MRQRIPRPVIWHLHVHPDGPGQNVGLRTPPKLQAPPHYLKLPCLSPNPTLPNYHTQHGDHNNGNGEIRLPAPLLLSPLLHPPARRHNALITTAILVHLHPILLPLPPHLLALTHRRALHAPLPQHHDQPAALAARRQSDSVMDGFPRGREPR